MSLVPTWPIAAICLAVGVAAGAAGSTWWHSDTINDLELKISRMERDAAVGVSIQYKQAADNLVAASQKVSAAASEGSTDIATLNAKLDTINRSIKNAKPVPLPADCRPGPVRVRNLTESAAAVDAAIAGSVPRK